MRHPDTEFMEDELSFAVVMLKRELMVDVRLYERYERSMAGPRSIWTIDTKQMRSRMDYARTDWTKERMIFIIFYNNKNVQLSWMDTKK